MESLRHCFLIDGCFFIYRMPRCFIFRGVLEFFSVVFGTLRFTFWHCFKAFRNSSYYIFNFFGTFRGLSAFVFYFSAFMGFFGIFRDSAFFISKKLSYFFQDLCFVFRFRIFPEIYAYTF